jgi:outer membrane protein, heavy metal efflux system
MSARHRVLIGLWASLLGVPAGAAAQLAPPPLRLAEIYAEAEARNPMAQAATAGADAARARQRAAGTLPDPRLQLGVMNASLPGLRTDMPTSMAPSVQVMQMIPTAGKLALAGRIARQETSMAEAAAAEVRWEVRGRAAMSFYEVYQADRQLAVMGETRQLLRTFEQVARSMYAAGMGRQSDVLRAGVEVARMDAEIRRMEAMRAAAGARLNATLNRPAASPIGPAELPILPGLLPPADTLARWAEASRPMLARGRAALQQAGTRRQLAAREIWPDLEVGVQYGQRSAEMGTERMGSLMLGFTLPVFAARRQYAMRRESEAMERMAGAELTEMRAQVGARIGELIAGLERDRTLARLYRTDVLPQSEANVQSALAGYRSGSVDFMTLVDAQMTANQYRQELSRLVADYGTLLAELEMTVGRALPATGEAVSEAR